MILGVPCCFVSSLLGKHLLEVLLPFLVQMAQFLFGEYSLTPAAPDLAGWSLAFEE